MPLTLVSPPLLPRTIRGGHWHGEDVATLETSLALLPDVLPVFARYGFGRNRFRDVIVRKSDSGAEPLQIAVVSKKYVLVQHADAIRAVTGEIAKAGIDPAAVPARLLITEYGSRIALRATLPREFDFTPPDGHPMALTFECFNSVDGTVPLFAAVGWFRFVCSNGLVVGTATAKVRQRHVPPLEVAEISDVLAEGMEAALQDRESLATWASTEITDSRLAEWVDGPVAEAWGPLAAARAYTIATTGFDGESAPPFKRVAPHRRTLRKTTPVPGTDAPCRDGYGVAQVLAWLAARRDNIAQRIQWRAQIRSLMSQLVPAQG